MFPPVGCGYGLNLVMFLALSNISPLIRTSARPSEEHIAALGPGSASASNSCGAPAKTIPLSQAAFQKSLTGASGFSALGTPKK